MNHFNMMFNNLSTIEIITQANDPKTISQMDRDDMVAMIEELASRLEDSFYMAMDEVDRFLE